MTKRVSLVSDLKHEYRKEGTCMNLIAAVDENWGIGRGGRLLVSIPADLKSFQKMTMGKTVVMGRRTLESLPGSMPLTGRTNIVLTANPGYKVRKAIVVSSVTAALEELKNYRDEDIFIIGGESIYRQFLPYCNVAHITKIHRKYEADVFFPDLDACPDWKIVATSDEQTCFDLEYHFIKYEKKRSTK